MTKFGMVTQLGNGDKHILWGQPISRAGPSVPNFLGPTTYAQTV